MGTSAYPWLGGLVKQLARECGFELAGIARAEPLPEAGWYLEWVERGYGGQMRYLTGERAQLRTDPRRLLPTARSVICLGKLYNTVGPGRAGVSRHAWGEDYHRVLRRAMKRLVARLGEAFGLFEWKACVDTAPLLERAHARRAGLGWIGKNTCLINQAMGSWFVLGELLVSLQIELDHPPPDRCGTCTRCIDACPTKAIIPTGWAGGPTFTVDANRCLSYLTIEYRGEIPHPLRPAVANHAFGCDICQEVCPWNRRAPVTDDPAFCGR